MNDELKSQFSGIIGEDYDVLEKVCPSAIDVRSRIGSLVAAFVSLDRSDPLAVVDIGCGSGLSTLPILESSRDAIVVAIDNEPTMLSQARSALAQWLDTGRLSLIESDAVAAVAEMPSESVDIVASVEVLHNFLRPHRSKLIREMFRILRPNGLFLNGDRYALDDVHAHQELMQREARNIIQGLSSLGRVDLLEEWIAHLFSDENPERVMREAAALTEMKEVGFRDIQIVLRNGITAVVRAVK